jgi:DNA-binding response OmpR family regulator
VPVPRGVAATAQGALSWLRRHALVLGAGFAGYLSKPISVRELPHQVAGFLREKHDDA